jgi:Zn-dependent protease with chaperone function
LTKLAKLAQFSKKTIELVTRFTFPIRRGLLWLIVTLGVFGIFLFNFPLELRLIYDYGFVTVMTLGLYSEINVYAQDAVQLLAMTVRGNNFTTKEYSTPKIEELKTKMKLQKIKVFVTNNKFVRGPFTNAISCKVYLTSDWMEKYDDSEILSVLAHEFGHIQTRRRFVLEVLATTGTILILSVLLSIHTIPIIAQVTEIAGFLLGITFVCWNNERRADMISARTLGPEGLISVLEHLQSELGHDDGSETHPPLKERIARLTRLLDADKEAST